MKEVLYASPFVPVEWIAAHGLRPRSVVEKLSGSGAQPTCIPAMGACHFAEIFLQMAASAEAAVFVTSCDQMRRAADQAVSSHGRGIFLMNVPATWQSPEARGLYRSEIERLGRFLIRLGGVAPTRDALAAEMRRSARERDALSGDRAPADTSGLIPLALVGESLLPSHLDLLNLIGSRGGRVALDATSSGERGHFPDEVAIGDDPFPVMVDGYFDRVTDVFQRPNTRLYDWLRPRVSERGIRGIILWHYSWCDLWRAEANRLREEFPLPVLQLDAGESLTPSMRTRVEVFLEILRA